MCVSRYVCVYVCKYLSGGDCDLCCDVGGGGCVYVCD